MFPLQCISLLITTATEKQAEGSIEKKETLAYFLTYLNVFVRSLHKR